MEDALRTNIGIDGTLLAQAMAATGQTTKKATVEKALRLVVRLLEQHLGVAVVRA